MSARLGTGRGTRLAIFLHVVLGATLALASLLLVNWLSARPGMRYRMDLTAAGQNTLSTAALGVLNRLEEEIWTEFSDDKLRLKLVAAAIVSGAEELATHSLPVSTVIRRAALEQHRDRRSLNGSDHIIVHRSVVG